MLQNRCDLLTTCLKQLRYCIVTRLPASQQKEEMAKVIQSQFEDIDAYLKNLDTTCTCGTEIVEEK